MIKKLIIALYTLIIVCIGLATVIEKLRGTSFVSEYIYGAWWFSALWALLTVSACAYILKQRLYRRMAVMLLHLAFVVILAGALTTHLFARRGTVGLRTGNRVTSYTDEQGHPQPLPFTLTLSEFRIVNYPGTDAPLDFQSVIQCDNEKEVIVSMNHIGQIDGYRLFQSSYDSDQGGVTLGVSYDPYGIAITYAGYLLLLVGIIATLLSRQTHMRSLYRKAITGVMLLTSLSTHAQNSMVN
ncbi:MAG: cytochrome c biogenesis protein ResB, partial [Bacteroidales bacterium]|nr:cytochrome c biogenesis protein ResB [Bacteroidales bacterium]